ncbi:MAG: hypothetical protein ACE5G9_13490 [Nitrospinales bacterium]
MKIKIYNAEITAKAPRTQRKAPFKEGGLGDFPLRFSLFAAPASSRAASGGAAIQPGHARWEWSFPDCFVGSAASQ